MAVIFFISIIYIESYKYNNKFIITKKILMLIIINNLNIF